MLSDTVNQEFLSDDTVIPSGIIGVYHFEDWHNKDGSTNMFGCISAFPIEEYLKMIYYEHSLEVALERWKKLPSLKEFDSWDDRKKLKCWEWRDEVSEDIFTMHDHQIGYQYMPFIIMKPLPLSQVCKSMIDYVMKIEPQMTKKYGIGRELNMYRAIVNNITLKPGYCVPDWCTRYYCEFPDGFENQDIEDDGYPVTLREAEQFGRFMGYSNEFMMNCPWERLRNAFKETK